SPRYRCRPRAASRACRSRDCAGRAPRRPCPPGRDARRAPSGRAPGCAGGARDPDRNSTSGRRRFRRSRARLCGWALRTSCSASFPSAGGPARVRIRSIGSEAPRGEAPRGAPQRAGRASRASREEADEVARTRARRVEPVRRRVLSIILLDRRAAGGAPPRPAQALRPARNCPQKLLRRAQFYFVPRCCARLDALDAAALPAAPARNGSMHAALRVALWTVGILLLVVVLAALGLRLFDWNLVKDEIAAQLGRRLGTKVAIAGDLDIGVAAGLLTVQARGVRVDGTLEAAEPLLALERLEAGIALAPLLRGDVVFDRIALTRPRLTLIREGDGDVNWDFGRAPDEGESAGGPVLPPVRQLVVNDGSVIYRDHLLDATVRATIDRLSGFLSADAASLQ